MLGSTKSGGRGRAQPPPAGGFGGDGASPHLQMVVIIIFIIRSSLFKVLGLGERACQA